MINSGSRVDSLSSSIHFKPVWLENLVIPIDYFVQREILHQRHGLFGSMIFCALQDDFLRTHELQSQIYLSISWL